jgi:hypothetical protein
MLIDFNTGGTGFLRRVNATVSALRFLSTTRQWAKKQVNLEVTSKARTQAFGATTYRKRLEDKPLEAPRFSAGF